MRSLLLCLFTITIFSYNVFSADFYWIGGGGNWSSTAHWSSTSGGATVGTLPTATDNVFFDNLSGLDSVTAIVTLDIDVTVSNFNFAPINGEFLASGRIINCSNFYSNGASSTFTLLNSTINVANGTWEVINASSLVWASTNSVIQLNAVGTSIFTGGNLTYNGVISFSSTLEMYGNNSFNLLKLAPSSILTLENASTQSFDSLSVTGTCTAHTFINTLDGDDVPASLQKTGYSSLKADNLTINNVNALTGGGYIYTLTGSAVTASNGWSVTGIAYYWIGDGGNWSDVNHWSYSSGGLPAGCIPYYGDSVFFNANSFSSSNQEVFVDVEAFFSYMDWTSATGNQVLKLDTTMYSKGDITLNPGLFITRTNIEHRIEFTGQSLFDPNSALIDCNFSVYMDDASQSFLLQNELIMTDTSAIYLLRGGIDFQNQDVTTGTIFVYEVPGMTKSLDFGSSTILLKVGMNSENTANFTFNAGTSLLKIGSVNNGNFLITNNLTFSDVELDFSETGDTQLVSGDNVYTNLTILKGSDITFETGSIQTINTGLFMQGTCQDSIRLTSIGTPAYFQKATTTNVTAECIDFTNIGVNGATQTALFSTGNVHPGWNLSSLPAITADFSVSGGFCFGDTTLFTNNSTVISGNPSDITSIWYFGDGSGYYHFDSPLDSTWISYVSDTNKHVFIGGGAFDVVLQTTNNTNFCMSTDTVAVYINKPGILVTTSDFDKIICQGDEVKFIATSNSPNAEFQFYLNGTPVTGQSQNDTLYVTTSLNHLDTISVLSFENGCVSDTMPKLGFTVNDLPDFTWISSDADTSICLNDLVNFSISSVFPTNTYQYLLNGNPVTSFNLTGAYSSITLSDGDEVSIIGKTNKNCRDTSAMVFEVRPLPNTSLSSSIPGNVICTGDQVNFTASGADKYEFFIDGNSQGIPSAVSTWSTTLLASGNVVTVMGYYNDGCGKQASESFSYTVNVLPSVNLTMSGSTSICSGQSVLFSASGASQYEFFVNGVSQGALSPTNSYTSSTLVDQDIVLVEGVFSGCSNTSTSYTFTVLTSPTTTLTSDATANTLCSQNPVILTASGATNYEFFVNGVSQGAPSTTNIFTTSTLTNGQVVTVNGESNTCIVTQSITFTVLPKPSVNLFSNDPDNTICEGEVITFTGTNAVQYEMFINSISQGAPQASPTFTPTLSSGTNSVYVIGTAVNGCTNTSQNVLTVTVNPIPTIVLTSSDIDNEICANESVTFTGSGSNMYQFFINGISQGGMSMTNTFTTSDLINGQVIKIVGSSLGCTSNSNVLTFTVNPSPNVTLSSTDIDNVFCLGDNVTYTASGAANYEFFVNGVSQGPSSSVTTINSSGFTTGTFLVEVYGEQSNCSDHDSKLITVNAIPSATISCSDIDNTICSGETVNYNASGGTLYQFSINSVPQSSPSLLNAFTSSSLNNGDIVSVIITSSQGCSSFTFALPIVVNPTPVITLVSSDLDNEICINESVIFTASGAGEYEFFINGVSQGPSSTLSTLTTSILNSGDVVSVIGSASACESTSNNVTTVVHPYPIISLINNGDNEICENELVDLVATGGTSYQYLINGVPVGVYTPSPIFNGVVNNSDVITVNGQNNGCSSLSSTSVQYTVHPYPNITSNSSDADNIICKDETVNFSVSGAMEYVFELNGNNVQSGTITTFSSNTLETGDIVSITGYNGDCPSSVNQFVFVVNEMNLAIAPTPSNLICEGTTVTFTATGADLYEFYLNGSSQGSMSATNSISLSGLSNLDEITFVGKSNTTLCIQNNTDYIIMNVMETPVLYGNTPYEFCEGDSIVLISNSSYGNQWMLNGNPIAGATDTFYVAYQQGTYSIEVTHGGNGSIWSFGANAGGTFGDGTNINSLIPTKAVTTESFIELESGSDFVLAVTGLGQVYSWGKNNYGQLGNGTYTNSPSPILIPSLSGIKTVATTETSSMAVTNTGNVYVWGENIVGQLATGNTSVINFPYQNPTLTNVDSIAAGKNHFLFLKNDGTVWATGYNASGQLGQGNLVNSLNATQVPGLSNIVSIGAGEYSSYAINNAGNLYVWGGNSSGQLGLGDLTNRLVPTLSSLKKIRKVQGGATHTVFTTIDNQIYTVGGNNYGQLGLNDNNDRLLPVKVNIGGVQQVSAGHYTTLLKRTDNSVFGFGDNSNGQLSTIAGASVNTPTHIDNLDGVIYVEAGRLTSHTIFGVQNSCTSSGTNVTVHTIPVVTITVTNNVTLTATAGATSYQWYLNGLAIPGANSQIYTATTTGSYTVLAIFGFSCSGSSDPQYVGFTGLDKQEFLIDLIGYPNPTTGVFYLNFDNFPIGEQVSIVIMDYTGREVKRFDTAIQPLMELSLADLSSGVYHTKVKYGNFEKIIQVVKIDE